jgi:bacillithiol system protein YtxJ
MTNQLTELKTVDDLDRLLASAPGRAAVIYKHSTTCGTSGMALEEIRGLLVEPGVGAPVGLVLVQAARPVSIEIATRFGVRHESPQVLVVRDGRVVWHASHFRVTAEAITKALADAGAEAGSR